MSFDLRLEMYPVEDGGKLERIEVNGGLQEDGNRDSGGQNESAY